MLAYDNKPIIKTHNLVELYELLSDRFDIEDDKVFLLSIATTYQTKQRYPVVQRKLPSEDEIKEVLYFTEVLFQHVIKNLKITENEILN